MGIGRDKYLPFRDSLGSDDIKNLLEKELRAEMPTFCINYQSEDLISSAESQSFAKPSRRQTPSINPSLRVTSFRAQ